ncbi:helix-turn-helix transcriptional regulator [Salmonella enterica]|nr:helix-turn-helix transcriptional regulator [Salmonella enterica subsp. enterica serovar Panama]EDW0700988.1 helix-turn-helix transcriptional regulator [Salmonella enterica subsp. enterica]EHG9469359.1 helix-turn-helix transcriptional regulator [Salmonella enterica subsp. enterica serovar Newport]EJG7682124.1 helix-turn-helix transcriptional regulator [Salmonella enterica]HAF1587684.1 helix-turn-helix transcriptional regulator [Salmonella enterica]
MKTTLAERLNAARKAQGLTQKALGDLVGISQAAIQKIETGKASSSTKIIELAKVLDVHPEWLSSGEGPAGNDDFDTLLKNKHPKSELKSSHLKVGVWEEQERHDMDEFVEVPLINVRFAAGHGNSEIIDDEDFTLVFRRYSLHRMGVSAGNAKLVRVSGDSMTPALNDGDVVGIDTSSVDIKDGKTYALCHDGMLRVKTLISQPGKIIIRSLNRVDYPDEALDREHFMRSVRIVGRVFWSSHAW